MDAENITISNTFDIIIASDCLEHIKNDENAIKNWHKLLKPKGTLYVFVPAFNFLWSNHDVVNMHFRRYTKKKLIRVLNNSSFKITKASYWNFILFFPILITRLLNKLPFINKKNDGELKKFKLFNTFFLNIINTENKVLRYVNFPFGVSTFCIAKKRK